MAAPYGVGGARVVDGGHLDAVIEAPVGAGAGGVVGAPDELDAAHGPRNVVVPDVLRDAAGVNRERDRTPISPDRSGGGAVRGAIGGDAERGGYADSSRAGARDGDEARARSDARRGEKHERADAMT